MNKYTILIVDDEPQIRKLLQINLESNDYKIITAANGREGILLCASYSPDLVILDIGLPDISGHKVIKELRDWYQNPILILSVMDNENDIIAALDNGATDYITKPFRTGELLARIRSALKRNQNLPVEPIINFGKLQVNLSARLVKFKEEIIKLTATEYNLLVLFVKNEGRVLTHQFILKNIWGAGHQNETQYLRVFVGALRKKIEENPNNPQHIITESGVGYRFQ